MDGRIMKYNPAFLSSQELVEKFVVRGAELNLIVQAIRENTGQSNQHLLVIGPRGSGKTMLVLRAAEEVRRQKDLSDRWYPLVFAEESYQVTTPGEFWLEALFHLAQKTEDATWKAAHAEIQKEHDEDRLRERALAQLMDFADAQGKRLLLVVENLNMLLGDQMSDDDGWVLRGALLHEPRIMLLTTATNRFEEIDNADKAMFELFRTIALEPLDEGDCRRMWASISGAEPGDNRVRPIQILTGGNPRLVSIISSFGARLSFQELMTDLIQLVDDNTEYFKSHLDGLPVTERKVYLTLVELWDPAGAREVSEAARLDVNSVSALLRRLVERGAVMEVGEKGRGKLYQVAERMYNIYYLMRRHGAPSRRVKAVVNFMIAFYDEAELARALGRIAEEACRLTPDARRDHYLTYEEVLKYHVGSTLCGQIMRETPAEFLTAADAPAIIRSISVGAGGTQSGNSGQVREMLGPRGEPKEWIKTADSLIDQAVLLVEQENYEQAILKYDDLVRALDEIGRPKLGPMIAQVLMIKADTLYVRGQHAAAMVSYNEVIRRFADAPEAKLQKQVARALVNKGIVLYEQEQYEEALASYGETLRRFANLPEKEIGTEVARALTSKAVALGKLKQYTQAIADCDEVVHRFADATEAALRVQTAEALINKGAILFEQAQYEQAIASCDEVMRRFADATEVELKVAVALTLVNQGTMLYMRKQKAEAIARFDTVIQRFGDAPEATLRAQVARALASKGNALREQKEYAWSVTCWDEIIRRFADAPESELRTQVAQALFSRGFALGERKEYARAIASYDELVRRFTDAAEFELRTWVACTLFNKGSILRKQKQYGQAIASYDEIVQRFGGSEETGLNGPVARALFYKGCVLHEQKQYAQAAASYDEVVHRFGDAQAVVLKTHVAQAMFNKGAILYEQHQYAQAAANWRQVDEIVNGLPGELGLCNSLAWAVYQHRLLILLAKAESWARNALAGRPEDARTHHTLASVLCLAGKGVDALHEAGQYLQDTEVVEDTPEDGVDLFVGLAASGHARETLEILQSSSSAKILEPLTVGLRLFIGQDVKVAAEIVEVARDVVTRIEERRKELELLRATQGQKGTGVEDHIS